MWLNGMIVQLLFLFVYSNTPVDHIWVVSIFVRKEKVNIYPCFPRHFIQFSKTVLLIRNESTWILSLLANGKFEISIGFCNFSSYSKLFWPVQPSSYTNNCFWHSFAFQSRYCCCLLASLFSHLYSWYVYYIFSLLFCLVITYLVFHFCFSAGFLISHFIDSISVPIS